MKWRSFTFHELLIRALQIVRSRAEGIALYRWWLKSQTVLVPGVTSELVFSDLEEILTLPFRQNRPQGSSVQVRAERYLSGRFDVFDLKNAELGIWPDWHVDPKEGKRSPLIAWRHLNNLSEARTGNKKYVWEINRHHHVVELARAYAMSGDERFAQGVTDNLRSWIDVNPPAMGINWVSSLELAFRCINWMWAIAFVRRSRAWRELETTNVARSLHEQLCHVERFLSTYSSPNTHLTGEALALYYAGICLPGFARAKRWRQLGRSILLQQINIQIRPDGGYFEQSTWYHRYTAEFYLQFAILARRTGEPLPESSLERIQKLMNVMLMTARPDGTWSRFGDDDGGTLLPFGGGSGDDWRSVLAVAGVLFMRSDYLFVGKGAREDAMWLVERCPEMSAQVVGRQPPDGTDGAFRESGWFSMRSDWSPSAHFMMIDAGPHGTLNCGHAHADALSIEVCAFGAPLLVDRGTYTYSEMDPARNELRSTAMHNTLEVAGHGSSLPARGPFQWLTTARSGTAAWQVSEELVYFRGWQDGYMRLASPAMHSRAILFVNREYWVLLDEVDSGRDQPVAVHFHWHPSAAVTRSSDQRRIVGAVDGAALDVIYPDGEGEWQMAPCTHSPGFGERTAAVRASYLAAKAGTGLLGLMLPCRTPQDLREIQTLPVDSGRAISVGGADCRDVIFWRTASPGAEEIQRSDFEWLWLRSRRGGHGSDTLCALAGRHLVTENFAIHSEEDIDFLKILRDRGGVAITTRGRGFFRLNVGTNLSWVTVNGQDVDLKVRRDIAWPHGRGSI